MDTINERIIQIVTSDPSKVWSSSEIEDQIGVSYPLSKNLYMIAADKRIRNRGRGKWSAPKGATPTSPRTRATDTTAIKGVISDEVTVEGTSEGLLATVGTERYELTWTDFVTVLRATKT